MSDSFQNPRYPWEPAEESGTPPSSGYEYQYPQQPPQPAPQWQPAEPPRRQPLPPPERAAQPTFSPERLNGSPRSASTQPAYPRGSEYEPSVSSRGAEYDPPAQTPPPSGRKPKAPRAGSPSGGRKWVARLVPFIIGVLLISICGGIALAGGVYAYYANTLPPAETLATVNTDQSTKIYDRNGDLLYEIIDPNLGRHTIIPPERIPPVLKQATLATEDPSFYSNPGVDWYALARAIYYLVRYQEPVSGASTITQQLIKTALLSPEQTLERKIKEAILALEVTRRYPKDQILAFYLNTINYGNRSYGIQSAAQSYFEKDVEELNLAEASLLSGLPQLPAIYDPCINPDRALRRQQVVLDLMVEQGMIDNSQAEAAAHEMNGVVYSEPFVARCQAGIDYARAPHFVEYVRQALEAKYGPEFERAGYHVYTTLDPQMQTIVEEEARKQIAAIQDKNVKSAAAVVVDPRNGEIYAMLGSVDFDNPDIDGQVNVTTRLRQPGSSIKPFTYLAAFEKGWTPATPIYDLTTDFPNGNLPPYVPTNYDDKEHGLVTARSALANSYNIPAVKTLYAVGLPELMGLAQRFGITSFTDPSRYGLSLTLGGGEVTLTELTGAYAALANSGQLAPLTPFTRIVDGQGRTIYNTSVSDAVPQQVTDARYAYQLTSILSDNAARTPAFGANSPLKVSRPAFVKTGTTNDYKDNWTLGGTPELVIGVWVGNPRNEAMQNVSGITGAAPIWHNVLERVYAEHNSFKGIAPHDFPIPAGLVQAEVCNESGLVPTESCPADHRHSEIFLTNQAPTQFDDVWVKLAVDPTTGMLADPNCAPEFVEERVFARLHADGLLPYERIRDWGAAHGFPVPPAEISPCTGNPDQPDPEPFSARVNRPNEGEQVSGIVPVNGRARLPNGGSWIVEAGRNGQWVTLATGSGEAQGRLAEFDANSFGEGELDIRLTVTNEWGQPTEAKVRVYVIAYVPPTFEPTPEPTFIVITPVPTVEIPTPIPPTPILPTPIPPTIEPTEEPTQEPTEEPTQEPTQVPTIEIPVTETPQVINPETPTP